MIDLSNASREALVQVVAGLRLGLVLQVVKDDTSQFTEAAAVVDSAIADMVNAVDSVSSN